MKTIYKRDKWTDDRFVWHCPNRHTAVCHQYYVCRGTECKSYNGSNGDPEFNKNKQGESK